MLELRNMKRHNGALKVWLCCEPGWWVGAEGLGGREWWLPFLSLGGAEAFRASKRLLVRGGPCPRKLERKALVRRSQEVRRDV